MSGSVLNLIRDVRRWLAEGDFPTVKTTTVYTDHVGQGAGAAGVTFDNDVTIAEGKTFNMSASAADCEAVLTCYAVSDLLKGSFRCNRYGGTSGAPAAVDSGDVLGGWHMYGWDGTDLEAGAQIVAQTTQDWTHTPEAHGTKILFSITKTGADGLTTLMELTSAGLLFSNTHDILSETPDGSDIGSATQYFGSSYITNMYADHITERTGAHTIVIDSNVTMTNTKDILAATAGGSDLGATGTGWGDIFLDTTKKVQFRDSNISISSADDGHLDIAADTSVDIAAITKIGDGGTTNYAQFAADGELTLAGTARVRKTIVLANAFLGKGTAAPDEVVIGNFTGWEFDINDDCVITHGLPKDWASGTDITIELSWYVNEAYATNSGEVKWQVAWSMCPHDGSEAIDAPTHASSGDTGDVNIPATAKHLSENTVVTIPAASIAVGDEIGITLKRIALTAGNNPTAKPTVIHVYIRYIADKLGTAT